MTTLELLQWWLGLHWAWGVLLALLAIALVSGFFLGTLSEISSSLKQIARELRAQRESGGETHD